MNRLLYVLLSLISLPLKLILYGSLIVWDYLTKTVDSMIQSAAFEMLCSYYGLDLTDDDTD